MTENATTTIVAVKYQKTAPHHTMNKEGWEKEFDEKFPIHYFETNIISPEQIKTFITEQRRRAREEERERLLRLIPEEDGNFKYLSSDTREFAKQLREILAPTKE